MMHSLSEDLVLLFDNQEACDVFFSVEENAIGAHKVVLKIRSQLLYDMATGWSLGNNPIPIENIDYETFKAMLRYMYSGDDNFSKDNVFKFLSASKLFKMDFLEELCVNHIAASMGIDNICHYMNEAINFKSSVLQEKCCDMFREKTGQIVSQKSFNNLSQPALSALLGVDQTNMVEVLLFQYTRQWMEQQCRDQGLPVNGTNMRHVIGDGLYKIRFPAMNVQDFANSVTTISGFLTENERVQIFEKITVFDNEDIECPFSDKHRCQVSRYYTAFSDVKKLLKEKVLYNGMTKNHCDISSIVQFAKDQPDGKEICRSVHSMRFIMQCCADLANSCPVLYNTAPENQAARNNIYDEFFAWQNFTNNENVSDIMTKFMQLRSKLDKLYRWSW